LNKFMAFLVFSIGVPALATTYTVPAGSSAATIQGIVNTAGSVAGNTVMFSAGSYSLASTVILPCTKGTIYTGPNVGVVTQTHRPAAVLTSTVTTAYALQTNSNGTTFTGNQGCTIEYLVFSGTQGGIYVTHPSSGIVIQYNYFTLNNPPVGGAESLQAVYVDGDGDEGLDPSTGASYISILWNVFYNNCALINAEGGGNGNVDSGGLCAATLVSAYNNHLVWNNNTVNLIEEALKFEEQSSLQQTSINADVENNNMQGNSRIMIETQQDTNGVGEYNHNAFYKPNNPNNGTFELSMPEFTPSTSPTHSADDNVFISNVPITGETGPGAHYGIGLELWGAGSIATNNLFQGGNGAESCGAGYGCTGWNISVGEAFTNANVTGNYFSGTDTWSGTANNVSDAVDYEDGGSSSNAGIVISPNTVVKTSTTIPTVAPTVSPVSSSAASTVTLSDSDTKHRLSIFYTTDGTKPAIFGPSGSAGSSRVYSVPFSVPAGTIVKAIASWGQGANQGIVFPSFGYIPSAVVTGVVTASGRTVTSFLLHPASKSKTMPIGSTMQLIAYATYSDGSTGTLPDAEGNKVTWWNTTNHAVAKISSAGHATALATGSINMEAMVGSLTATPWPVTVGAAAAAASVAQAAPVAAIQEKAAASIQAPAAADTQAAAVPEAQSELTALTPGPAPAAPGAALPDTFLGPFWKIVTPAGGSASISNSHLFLGVPGGGNHDPLLPSNQAVRVVQTIGNEDFDVAVKIDSPLFAADGNTSQGLMVLSGNEDFITFALTTDGTKVGLNARIVTGGAATTVLDDTDFSQYQNPMYLRITKARSAYVALYSVDGENWTQAASFTDVTTFGSIGPFASNYNSTPANATPVVMSVNWFDVRQ
jgi:Chitobiase/beta-hexosaminidase C-terminal domain/Bacterial Ig-like domain (group 2)